jgi:hypothetical protein
MSVFSGCGRRKRLSMWRGRREAFKEEFKAEKAP